MKHIIFPIIFSSLLFGNLNAQNFSSAHYQTYQAELFIEGGLYSEADSLFQEIFQEYDFRFWEPYKPALDNMFKNLNRSWDTDSNRLKKYIVRFAKSDFGVDFLISYLMSAADLNTKRSAERVYHSVSNHLILEINQKLGITISQMIEVDQRVRNEELSLPEEMTKVDSVNWIELEKIIKKHGKIPGIKEIGLEHFPDFVLLLTHHCQKITTEPYRSLLFEAVQEGALLPRDVAYIIDYANFGKSYAKNDRIHIPYSTYGVLIIPSMDAKTLVIPVKNLTESNSLRRLIGLPPIEYDIKKQAYIYDVEEFKKYWNLIEE